MHRLNAQAVRDAKGKPHKIVSPESLNRRLQNTPWPSAELKKSGTVDPCQTYAASKREHFRRKTAKQAFGERSMVEGPEIVHGMVCV